MALFHRKRPPVQEPAHTQDEVGMETSTCTGEKLIGFKNKQTGRLEQAVIVRSRKDIDEFYRLHNIAKP